MVEYIKPKGLFNYSFFLEEHSTQLPSAFVKLLKRHGKAARIRISESGRPKYKNRLKEKKSCTGKISSIELGKPGEYNDEPCFVDIIILENELGKPEYRSFACSRIRAIEVFEDGVYKAVLIRRTPLYSVS